METTYPDFFTENIKKDLKISDIEKYLEMFKNDMNFELLGKISSPLLPDKTNIFDICLDYNKSIAKGLNHLKIIEYQKKFGNQGLSSNIHLPILEADENQNPIIKDLIIINHPDDAKNIAKTNIKKLKNFQPIVLDSIISTTDNHHWKKQRNLLNNAFLPSPILKNLFSKSNLLAKSAVAKLNQKIIDSNHSIDMNDFLLEITQQQLQRVMLGMSENFNKKTNSKIRNAFNGKGPKGYTRDFALEVLEEINKGKFSDLEGPISKILKENNLDYLNTETYGNLILLAFAGHDTTGHTLTWLLYELSNHKKYQQQLQLEVDLFWKKHNNNLDNLTYDALKDLTFMTKCIHETLRLWPAVANGTFRELEYDTEIHGCYGNLVSLPKGTYTQVFNYSRHRNPEIWGDDAHLFNPEREWLENEIWNNEGFSGYNISSHRFSPFSFAPRDCLGKNFAQMEMRLILLYLIRDYHFTYDKGDKPYLSQTGFNRATLAPIDVYESHNYPETLLPVLETGCWFFVENRQLISRL